ncbi:ABC1 kinase family protein [Ruania alba]|uniref:Ubiquinone biosynthesis protein n=1 Tax=Ruania alba TaxID=648782 RepID=A0A1H5L7F9_9MICO|nr:AarF/UbiB family protein [Ruania alba]SEE72497.1 ubiquinone biosynthesis protein [Ruania alba]
MVDFLGAQLTLWSVAISVLLFALFVRRVMGVRLSLLRTVVAALIGATAGPALLGALLQPPATEADLLTLTLYATLTAAFALIMAMFALATIEMLIPDGSLPGPVTAWRSLRGRVRRSGRYLKLLRVVVRHGLVRFLRGSSHRGVRTPEERRALARSLRRALEDGGVTFVKLGQQLSTRRDLLPAEFIAELTRLQDDASALDWPVVERVITAELGAPPEAVFATIDREPLAAASIAQVHTATTPDGDRVVLKVQRPGITAQVSRDLDILERFAGTLTARTTWAADLGLSDLVRGFAAALGEELDFRIERDNLATIASGLEASGAQDIRVPRVWQGTCTARLLVMDRLDGVPLGDAQPVLAELGAQRRAELATELLRVVLDQVTRHGVFHVDLHPGNVLVDSAHGTDDTGRRGALAMLDLGSVGRLGSQSRSSLTRLLAALGTGDSLAASDALLEAVDRPNRVDERTLEQELGEILLRFTDSEGGGSSNVAGAVAELFRLVARHRLGIPPQLAAAFRALATLDGTLAVIDPGFDLVRGAREASRARLESSLQPKELRRTVESELVTLLPVLRRLPRRMERIADAAEHGRLQVHTRVLADPADRRFVMRLWHQGLLTILAATAGLMATVLYLVAPGPMVTDEVGLFHVLGTALLAGSVILVMRLLVVFFRQDDEPR